MVLRAIILQLRIQRVRTKALHRVSFAVALEHIAADFLAKYSPAKVCAALSVGHDHGSLRALSASAA